jgi:hydrophobic/amphiphilic exporter-1 (mainly G- bacteria), HAE1 family
VQIENDVYTQIGLVMLIGLGAKNSILIIAFAKEQYEQGKPLVQASLEGARLRFRPLMMTALAFIFGCVPLWIASGAGSIARQVIGTTVIGGMLAETFIGRFFVPAIFVAVERLAGSKASCPECPPNPSPAPAQGD